MPETTVITVIPLSLDAVPIFKPSYPLPWVPEASESYGLLNATDLVYPIRLPVVTSLPAITNL